MIGRPSFNVKAMGEGGGREVARDWRGDLPRGCFLTSALKAYSAFPATTATFVAGAPVVIEAISASDEMVSVFK